MKPAPPLREPRHAPLAHLMRDGVVESVHGGSVVVLAPDGRTLFEAGDAEVACYPRSAAKPLQAAAMTRLGLDLPPELLALAAASHSGEPAHVHGARRILELAGLTESDLRCPAGHPYDPVERDAWIAGGLPERRLAHTCSGKHAAMLATAHANEWSTVDYLASGHPLQRRIVGTIEELAGQRVAKVTVDGCGAPLFAVSLRGLATAFSRIARAGPRSPEGLVAEAMRAHPEMVAGSRRDVTRLMRAVPGLITKDGIEGVQVAALPDGTSVAVKIADGGDRARLPVTLAALTEAGVDPRPLEPLAVSNIRTVVSNVHAAASNVRPAVSNARGNRRRG